MTVRIVTDSTSDVPPDVVEAHAITVVAAYINVGDQSFREGIDLTGRDFYTRLPTFGAHPSTAAPSSAHFAEAYAAHAAEGATDVISIHIAASLSAIYNSARLGAEQVSGAHIHLFETGQITMGSGWLVALAAEAAAAGESAESIMALLADARERVRTIAALDTLEYLRRGGRVNWAQFGLGTLLQIKPILQVRGGDIDVLERVRTRRRSLARLVEIVAEQGPLARLAVIHADAPAEAAQLQKALDDYFPAELPRYTVEVTPAIGVHVGPGAVGFACLRQSA